MNVALLGHAIRRKRIELGLTQQQLADMAALSRQTLNGIEHGHVNVTVDTLGRLLDVLGLTLEVADPEQKRGRPARAVWMAAKGASTSYSGELTPMALEQALITGQVPDELQPQVAQILDEAPLQLVTKMVAEVASRHDRKPTDIWKNLRRMARELMATRGGLWA